MWQRISKKDSPGNPVISSIKIPITIQNKVTNELEALCERENDVREDHGANSHFNGAAVHEIIDPSLNAYDPDNPFPRWIPSVFNVDKNGKTKILSPINNIDINIDKELYSSIESIFDYAVPLFEKSLGIDIHSKNVQVIVKSQKYLLGEYDSYEGGVHREGKEDNHISGVCLYYPKVKNIIGGELCLGGMQFGSGYTDEDEERMTRVPATEGTMFAFNNNTAFHKAGLMTRNKKSTTNDNAERIVLGFFLIDPLKPIPDSLSNINLNLRFTWKKILMGWTKNLGITSLPEDVVNLIGSHFEISKKQMYHERGLFKRQIRVPDAEKKYPHIRHNCNLD